MILKHFISGRIEANNYLLIDEKSKEAILIDCSSQNSEILKNLEAAGATLKYVLLTHGHFDHVLGINDIKKEFPKAEILACKDEEETIININDFMIRFGMEEVEIPKVDRYIDETEQLFIGDEKIVIIPTSGHTSGGVCYLIGDNLFSGDTIFLESVGRTDLPGGDFNELKSNIQNKVFTLDENITIYPGHGDFTTVGHEKIHNQFL